jgi:hypothetical protein
VQKKRQALIASECDEMQMAAPVMTNEFVGHGTKEKSKPRPSKSERVGHPEGQSPETLSQFLGVDVLEWYYPIVSARQQGKTQKGGPPAGHPEGQSPETLSQFLGVDVLEWYHPIVSARQQGKTQKGGPPAKCEPILRSTFRPPPRPVHLVARFLFSSGLPRSDLRISAVTSGTKG